MYKIGVVGDKDSILAFKTLGVEVFISYEEDETRALVDKLAKEDYGVIFITEHLAQKIEETVNRYNSQAIPAIILIPSNKGTLGIGLKNINKYVEKAVGSNIL